MTAEDFDIDEKKPIRSKTIQMGSVQEQEPDFDDPKGFVDDVQDEELVPDILATRPKEGDVTECVIIVDNVPTVSLENATKLEKLKEILLRLFAKAGTIESTHYPADDEQTKGFVFIEYSSKEAAVDAVQLFNGHRFDKQHTFAVNLFSDLDKYLKVSERWEKPKPRPYKDHGNLKYWLLAPECFDQFACQYEGGEKVSVYAYNPGEPQLVHEKPHWTETVVKWSPRGIYLATFHDKGVALWGGEKFEQINKFAHPSVSAVDFSPCENFIVTYAPPRSRYMDTQDALRVWEIRTGELKRAFAGGESVVRSWPYFKWSPVNDQYFAATEKDGISIYETSTFAKLDKKSLTIKRLKEFQWSPTDNMIAYWVAEENEIPARVALMQIPSKEDVRSKQIYSVSDARIYWQKSGDHVCMKMDRYGRKKQDESGEMKYSNISYNLEIFHCRDKGIPVDSIEIKDDICAFAWEPTGVKFALITGDVRRSVLLYSVREGNQNKIAVLKTLEPKTQANQIHWAPPGTYCVVATIKGTTGGTLMFIDANDMSITSTQEHTGATDVEWDPTGRFVVTSVSAWTGRGDYGYMVWNFQGQLRLRRPMDRFVSFHWRPRPPSILPEQQRKEVRKNMKKYTPIFEEKDRQVSTKASKEILEKRRQLKEAFATWLTKRKEDYEEQLDDRLSLRPSTVGNEALDTEVVQFLISEIQTKE